MDGGCKLQKEERCRGVRVSLAKESERFWISGALFFRFSVFEKSGFGGGSAVGKKNKTFLWAEEKRGHMGRPTSNFSWRVFLGGLEEKIIDGREGKEEKLNSPPPGFFLSSLLFFPVLPPPFFSVSFRGGGSQNAINQSQKKNPLSLLQFFHSSPLTY